MSGNGREVARDSGTAESTGESRENRAIYTWHRGPTSSSGSTFALHIAACNNRDPSSAHVAAAAALISNLTWRIDAKTRHERSIYSRFLIATETFTARPQRAHSAHDGSKNNQAEASFLSCSADNLLTLLRIVAGVAVITPARWTMQHIRPLSLYIYIYVVSLIY